MKSLDIKLQKIYDGSFNAKDFIIADAKDADMGGGRPAPGFKRDDEGRPLNTFLSFQEYLDKMQKMTESELIDVMLMSATSAERLVKKEIFINNKVTPAIRLNDTSCIWGIRHGQYDEYNSRHFATTQLRYAIELVDLGLYSMTFNKDVDLDIAMLNAYRDFRDEAEKIGMRHFLEVFNSKLLKDLSVPEMGEYVNDCILKSLSGQVTKEKPLFLKIAFNGAKAMDELASYDPGKLVIGILGGSKGTTRDCFELLNQAYKYGARVALFGRKINYSENQELIVKVMRKVVVNEVQPEEGVKYYHDSLIKMNITPDRKLEDDIVLTDPVLMN